MTRPAVSGDRARPLLEVVANDMADDSRVAAPRKTDGPPLESPNASKRDPDLRCQPDYVDFAERVSLGITIDGNGAAAPTLPPRKRRD